MLEPVVARYRDMDVPFYFRADAAFARPEIYEYLEAKGFEIDRRKIQLEEPLKTVGDFSVAIRLYREVTAQIKVTVAAEATEEVAAEAPEAEVTAEAPAEAAAVAEPAAE